MVVAIKVVAVKGGAGQDGGCSGEGRTEVRVVVMGLSNNEVEVGLGLFLSDIGV